MPPISWWLRSRPSRWYPDASATWIELVFHGSMYSSTRYRAGMVQANVVSAFNALLAMPRRRCTGATEWPAVARPADRFCSHSPIAPTGAGGGGAGRARSGPGGVRVADRVAVLGGVPGGVRVRSDGGLVLPGAGRWAGPAGWVAEGDGLGERHVHHGVPPRPAGQVGRRGRRALWPPWAKPEAKKTPARKNFRAHRRRPPLACVEATPHAAVTGEKVQPARRGRNKGAASSWANCSPVTPVTKRPPRIWPRASRRRRAQRISRHGTASRSLR